MKKTAEEILEQLIELFIKYLEELKDEKARDGFAYGEKTAYAECLEIIRCWERAEDFGLDFEVEDRFAL